MIGIDFLRLNGHVFERLTRALCFRTFGPAGTVFSSGPDGGRDFVFVGKTPHYPCWQGRLVVQAKFCETLRNSATDLAWLQGQLTRELEKLAKSAERPDYYIIATNVSLSGSDGTRAGKVRKGGLTKVRDQLETWKSGIGLKDFDVWPADKISDLLADAPEIRQTFGAWVTPGDVLSTLLKNLELSTPDFGVVIIRALKKSIRRDQFVRLKDAGSVSDLQIRTSQVFVDLPFSRMSALPVDDPPGMVFSLVERARGKLAPADELSSSAEVGSKVVVLGGPGQGKSTASLFLSQIFRAALLEVDTNTKFDDTVSALVPEVLKRAADQAISRTPPLRYPAHISLPRLADAISQAKEADQPTPSILAYLAEDISRLSDTPVAKEDLRRWLRQHPWIVVLDGLDEVPPSGERAPVIEAIQDFSSEVTSLHADVLIVLTTRPQGYNSDLNPNTWEHWTLTDLPQPKALSYAKGLALAQYPDDDERRSELDRRMRSAASQSATARLMKSPLQVTIMQMIVDTGGSVPAARWTLFNEYFEILKKREKSKGGALQHILERNMAHLGPIHQRVGLVLQAESEVRGGAAAALSHEKFAELLKAYLSSEGYQSPALEGRVREIRQVSLQRLVLLSTREEGSISFDVRSLQEYMAAAALTSGDPQTMEIRLNHIAGATHWRHVFLIAASRCFAEDAFHHRRSAVVGIPRQLETRTHDMLVRNGARLALDMFEDGLGVDHPVYRRQIALHALELLRLGPDELDKRLSTIWEPDTAPLLLEAAQQLVGEKETPAAVAAMALLVRLASRGEHGVVELLGANLPTNGEFALSLLRKIYHIPWPTDALVKWTFDTAKDNYPGVVFDILRDYFNEFDVDESEGAGPNHSSIQALSHLRVYQDNARKKVGILGGEDSSLSIRIVSIDGAARIPNEILSELRPGKWDPLVLSHRFRLSPSKETLADILEQLGSYQNFDELKRLMYYVAWPLSSIASRADNRDELAELAQRARSGEFGDVDQWRAAEKRWSEKGLSDDDLLVSRGGFWFGPEVASEGSPLPLNWSLIATPSVPRIAFRLYRIAKRIPSPTMRRALLHGVTFALSWFPGEEAYRREKEEELIELLESTSSAIDLDHLRWISPEAWIKPSDQSRLLAIVRRVRLSGDGKLDIRGPLRALVEDPRKRELLPIIAATVASKDEGITNLLPPSAFKVFHDDPPLVAASAVILSIVQGKWSDGDIAGFAKSLLHRDADALLNLLQDIPDLSSDRKHEILLASLISQAREHDSDEAWRLEGILRKLLDTRRSNLAQRSVWLEELKLPADAYVAFRN